MSLAQDLARYLGLTERYVFNIAAKADHAYFKFSVPKRDGSMREIYHPSSRLKALQRGLTRLVISQWPVDPAAMAYRPGINIRDNAEKHAKSNYLLRLDFENFFPSITGKDIDEFLGRTQPEWGQHDRQLFARLVCLDGRLTIGAPSSPGLSNAICFDLDRQLAQLTEMMNLVAYTRYADDLFFSSDAPDVLCDVPGRTDDIVKALEVPENLSLNHAKTRHSSRAGRRRVTGLVLGSDYQVRIGRQMKRKVRALVHQWDQLTFEERNRLAGTLAFIRDVEPEFLNQLYVKYGARAVSKALRGSP